jgi:hypothetical protein
LEATHHYPDLDSKNGIGSKKPRRAGRSRQWFSTAASVQPLGGSRVVRLGSVSDSSDPQG